MAGCEKIGWRVEEGTQKADPAVNNPPVAVPKLKPEGNEGVKVRRGDERVGRARVGEEPVPILHGQVEGLDVRETRRKAKMKTGNTSRKLEGRGDREEGETLQAGEGGERHQKKG